MTGPPIDAETAKRLQAAAMTWDETRQDWIPDPAVWGQAATEQRTYHAEATPDRLHGCRDRPPLPVAAIRHPLKPPESNATARPSPAPAETPRTPLSVTHSPAGTPQQAGPPRQCAVTPRRSTVYPAARQRPRSHHGCPRTTGGMASLFK